MEPGPHTNHRSYSTASSGFFQRALTIRSTSSRNGDSENTESRKGPLGLITIHEPFEKAVADLVFIHGLGGGSRKTWTKDGDPSLFWPQEWLPQDQAFRDVRIHMFGYDANWDKESILNIHDFAKDLLGWLKNSPSIPREDGSHIIFVCHSLGGLVAKRAYILSQQLKEYKGIGDRIWAIFFLATPHRGSNMAELLSRILQVSSTGSRPFVSDLHPNSVSIQAINDEFPRHSKHLRLYSYYETNPMNFGVKKVIIVPKDSAVLGYENEQSSFLSNANHREVCKFLHDQDPNYLTVRNGIASVVDEIRTGAIWKGREIDNAQHLWLKEYLNIDDTYKDHFQRIDSERIQGSCEWIARSETFQRWRDSPEPQFYWLTAKPGSGKSVVSGFVINHLVDLQRQCAFYFFTYGDKSKFSISIFLRSVAWQIASTHTDVFDFVFGQCKKDVHLGNADYRTIWRKLFLEGIFKINLPRKFYLVIDAVDECLNTSELIPLLVKSADVNTLRVFVTSRNSFDTCGVAYSKNLSIVSGKIAQSNTATDIGLYLSANLNSLPALGPDKTLARKDMMDSIVEKSSGCFLWVRLVLSELRNVHTSEEVRQVLEYIPSDMDQLYSYILESMSELKRGKSLTKAILAWTVCAVRPLTTTELHAALEMDVNDNVDDVERSIATTCGQLVFVDNKSKVQMLHQTAREFLLQPNNPSEFAITRREGQKRLAMVCLNYLCGRDMVGAKPRKRSATKMVVRDRSPFQDYACNALPDHIPFVESKDDEFFRALGRFFSSNNLLAWIEYIARESDLNRLVLTGRALKQYVQRRSKYIVPIGKDVALLNAWSTDLVRLVTKFGRNLSKSPTSIYNLIPPFCPPESVLKTQFGMLRRSMVVSGLKATGWDDCSSVIAYQQESPTTLACSLTMFAIGQKSGKIRIHHETTCQELRVLSHNQPVRLLRFGQNGNFLASVASRSVCIWNVTTWAEEWRFEIDSVCVDVTFLEQDNLLLAALLDNRMVLWDLTSGALRCLESWVDELDENFVSDRPITASIGCDSTMLAVAYRGHDVVVWDIENEGIHDIYGQDIGSLGPNAKKRAGIASAISLLFSPVAESALLAVGYNDGELVVFNTIEQKVQARTQANAHSIVSSPDGLLLACGNSAGIILIYEFDSLKPVYRIVSEEYGIKSLVFSANNQRLIDLRGPYCRVWDPPALLRDDLENEHNSDTVSISTTPQDYMLHDFDPAVPISSFVCAENQNLVICSKVDGSICLYDGQTGELKQELIHDTYDSAITCLCYNSKSRILTSADIDSSVISYQLTSEQNIYHAEKVFEHREGTAITQLLANESCTRLLISTRTSDTLCTIGIDGYHTLSTTVWSDRPSHKWSTHPTDSTKLIFFAESSAHIFSWANLERLTPPTGILMTGSILPELVINSITSCFGGEVLATTFSEPLASGSKSKLFLWPATSFTATSESATPIPHYQALADNVDTLIGTYNQRLVFLHQDGWVCSADPQNFTTEFFDRHFFFPTDYLSTSGQGRMMLGIASGCGNVIFVQNDELAVIQKGMEQFEAGQSRVMGKRPSISGNWRSG